MAEAADRASELLKVLAARNRLLILCQLIDGERSVGEIANRLGLRDAAVSQHLAVLRRERLVRPRRNGQTVYYALSGEAARRVLEVLYEIFCAPVQDRSEPTPGNDRSCPSGNR